MKVSIFVWRLLRNCIPTSGNLIRRMGDMANTQLLVGMYGKVEDVNHLFIYCEFFTHIWSGVLNSLDFFMVNLVSVSDHLIQFDALYLEVSQKIFDHFFFWFDFLLFESFDFQHKEETLQHLLDKIKIQSFCRPKDCIMLTFLFIITCGGSILYCV